MPGSAVLIFIVAGEPSGDLLGGRLMRALRERSSRPLRFVGVGGQYMRDEGLEVIFPLADIAVMGVGEVVPRLPLILKRLRQATTAAITAKPAAVVTIDSSSFNKRLARRLRGAGSAAPRIHYVAPMVWAWRPGRAKAMAKAFDHLITLLPFEPESFRAAGLPATWGGHPAIEAMPGDGADFRRRHGIPPDATTVGILPGSRMMEVGGLLPVFREAVSRLQTVGGRLHTVIPTVETVASYVHETAAAWPTEVTVLEAGAEKAAAFAAMDGALAASGTVTLELAVAKVPMVVAYRASAITAFFARRLLDVRHISLVNILAGRGVVPEVLQDDCTPERLAAELEKVLFDASVRRDQLAFLRMLPGMLTPPGDATPSQRAADIVLSLAFPSDPPQTPPDPQGPGPKGKVTRDE